MSATANLVQHGSNNAAMHDARESLVPFRDSIAGGHFPWRSDVESELQAERIAEAADKAMPRIGLSHCANVSISSLTSPLTG